MDYVAILSGSHVLDDVLVNLHFLFGQIGEGVAEIGFRKSWRRQLKLSLSLHMIRL